MARQAESFSMARMDGFNKVVTAVSLTAMALVVLVLLWVVIVSGGSGAEDQRASQAGQSSLLALVIVVAVMLVVMGLLWGLYRPRRLEISPQGLLLVWPLRSILIGPEEIKSIDFAGPGKTGRVWRVFGMGGLFGTFGLCRSKQLGFVDTYVTRRTDAVLIFRREGCGRPLLITPDRAEQFLVAARAMVRGHGHELD